MTSIKQTKRIRRHNRVRSHISGTTTKPRVSVFRSNQFIYAQLIDDTKGMTLLANYDKDVKVVKSDYQGKCAKSYALGVELGKLAIGKNISEVIFDRGGYRYHGRVAALAAGLREAGLKF